MSRPSQLDEKRKELIPVVARAFAELGFRRATTAKIARACGVRENILYRLWPDKKAMFIAAIAYVYQLSERVWEDLASDQGGADSARRLLEYEASHHGEFGLYRVVFAGLSETDDPDIRRALREMYEHFHQFIVQRLRRPAGRGKRGAVPGELAAWAIIGLGTVANIGRDLGFMTRSRRRELIGGVGAALLDATR